MTKKTQMSLLRTVIKSEYKNQLLNLLSELNTVHVKSKKIKEKPQEVEEDRLFSEKLKNLRQNLDGLFEKLKISSTDFQNLKIRKDEQIEFTFKNLSELLNFTYEEINFFYNRVVELEKYVIRAEIELENLNTIKNCYSFLENFNLTKDNISNFNHLTFRAFTTFIKNLNNLQALFEFNQFPNVYQYQQFSQDRITFFVIYPKDKEKEFLERISIVHAEEVPIYKKYLTSEGINFNRIFTEINLIKTNLSKYSKEQNRIRETNILKFAAINEIVQNIEVFFWGFKQFEELTSGRLSLKFFVPVGKRKEVISYLEKELKDNIIIESINIEKGSPIKDVEEFQKRYGKIEEEFPLDLELLEEREKEPSKIKKVEEKKEDLREETPTVMKNFFLFRPFETLTRLYGTPSYSEVDPTPFLFFTFPLLFGLMFGDIGHGLCLIISGLIGAFVYRKRKGSDLYNFCWIIFWCGWGAVLVGFLYGEFFGTPEIAILGIKLEPITIPYLNITLHNPLDNIMTLFKFAILVGVAHICLGWFIQFLNYWRQKHKYFAFTDSMCKIALLIGGTCLIFIWGLNINAWFSYPYPILLPLLPGLLLILFKPLGRIFRISYLRKDSYGELLGEGSLETFETALSILSNVASYIRLLALALAHIALMVAIQAMIGLITGEGIGFQILIVIGLIFGNLLVILIEGILVLINDIRLHFYEFFFKFYQGTGIEFFTFNLKEKYSHIRFKIESAKDIISEEIEKEIDLKKVKDTIDTAIKYISDKYF